MLGTIAKNLADGGYKVVEVEPTMEDISAHKDEMDLFIMYLGEYVDDVTNTLVYLKDICTEEDKLLILIGTASEIEVANRSIPSALISATFERPFDMKKLVEQLSACQQKSIDCHKAIAYQAGYIVTLRVLVALKERLVP